MPQLRCRLILPPTLPFPASLCLCVYYFNLKVRNNKVAGSRPRASICSSHQGQACSQALGAEPQSPGGGRCEAEYGEEGTGVLSLLSHPVCGPRLWSQPSWAPCWSWCCSSTLRGGGPGPGLSGRRAQAQAVVPLQGSGTELTLAACAL